MLEFYSKLDKEKRIQFLMAFVVMPVVTGYLYIAYTTNVSVDAVRHPGLMSREILGLVIAAFSGANLFLYYKQKFITYLALAILYPIVVFCYLDHIAIENLTMHLIMFSASVCITPFVCAMLFKACENYQEKNNKDTNL